MGLIEQSIKELRTLTKLHLAGKISTEQALAQVALYNQIQGFLQKEQNYHFAMFKLGKKALKMAEDANLLGENAAIDMGDDDEIEVIKCPAKERLVTRGECLDISGDKCPPDECEVCVHKQVTQKKLLPEE